MNFEGKKWKKLISGIFHPTSNIRSNVAREEGFPTISCSTVFISIYSLKCELWNKEVKKLNLGLSHPCRTVAYGPAHSRVKFSRSEIVIIWKEIASINGLKVEWTVCICGGSTWKNELTTGKTYRKKNILSRHPIQVSSAIFNLHFFHGISYHARFIVQEKLKI